MVYVGPALVVLLFLATAPLLIDTAVVGLITKILCYGLLAMSADIAFGYTGLWTFGHAALFGVAAYSTAMFLRYTDLHSFWIITPIALALTAVVAAIFAAIAARSSGLYFLLITFAMGQVIYSITMQWRTVTRGNEGLWGVSFPDIGFRFNGTSYYYFTLVVVAICALILYWFTKSPFGYSLEGIRENEVRARTMGYNTGLRKVIAFVISGIFAGVAGILFVYYNGGLSPESIGMAASGMAIIMVIIGGTATLWGGVIGSAVVLAMQYYISLYTPARWPIFLGAIFIAAVFFAGGGIFPLLANLWKKVAFYGSLDS